MLVFAEDYEEWQPKRNSSRSYDLDPLPWWGMEAAKKKVPSLVYDLSADHMREREWFRNHVKSISFSSRKAGRVGGINSSGFRQGGAAPLRDKKEYGPDDKPKRSEPMSEPRKPIKKSAALSEPEDARLWNLPRETLVELEQLESELLEAAAIGVRYSSRGHSERGFSQASHASEVYVRSW